MKPKKQLSFTFCRMSVCWQRVHRCEKCPDIWKVTSSGRAEIENVNYASGDIFNFTFATRVHFSTLTSVFHLWTSSQKNAPQIFYMSCINKFRWNLASCIAPILNSYNSAIEFNFQWNFCENGMFTKNKKKLVCERRKKGKGKKFDDTVKYMYSTSMIM